jgi:hypothetical protein
MSEAHPAIAVYGDTAERSFPLLMVVGREPNSVNNGPSKGVATYCFDRDDGPRCAFWNTSYGIAARSVGLSTRELKARCRSERASPIIYADALPITIRNQTRNKKLRGFLRVVTVMLAAIEVEDLRQREQDIDRVLTGTLWEIVRAPDRQHALNFQAQGPAHRLVNTTSEAN